MHKTLLVSVLYVGIAGTAAVAGSLDASATRSNARDGRTPEAAFVTASRVASHRAVAIDRQGQRSAAATIAPTTPETRDTLLTLAAPTGLEARVYSKTAGEIFWTRPATFGLVYDITRDGGKLVTIDGTSYFDDTLAAGRTYNYRIVAIDRQGRRSAAATIALTTPEKRVTPPALAAPTGLEARVYSKTAGEIFWTRPATFGLVYDITRDGRKLVTTDGTSYFDDTLAAGQTYTYSIVAIDRQGRRSAASKITLTTPGGSLITFDTHERLLLEVFEIYSGEAWDTTPMSLITRATSGGGRSLFESIESQVPFTSSPVLRAICRTGSGSLETFLPNSSASVPWNARLDACAPDPERTGLAFVSGSVEGVWNGLVSATSDELVWINASGERVRFDGEIGRGPLGFEPDATVSFIASEANQIVRDDADGLLLRSIEEATSTRRMGSIDTRDIATLSGGFTYRSERTGGLAVTVSTPVDLAYHWDVRTPAPDGVSPESLGELPLGDATQGPRTEEQHAAADRVRTRWAFTTGMLELQAEDGSRLVLDAGTGELDTVRITLDAGGGAGAEERVIDWPGSWYRALGPDGSLPSSRFEATPD